MLSSRVRRRRGVRVLSLVRTRILGPCIRIVIEAGAQLEFLSVGSHVAMRGAQLDV